jgi:hypothetical protein
LRGELLARSLIGVGLVLQLPHLLGYFADVPGHRLLFARKTLDAAHHLIALRVQRRIQRGEQRLRLLLLFLAGSDHIIRDQFTRVLHRGAARRQSGDELGLFRLRGFFLIRRLDRRTCPDTRNRDLRDLQLLARPVRIPRVQRKGRPRRTHGQRRRDAAQKNTH